MAISIIDEGLLTVLLLFWFLFQVGKKLSELIRDSGGQSGGGEQNRWQTELDQVAFELIGVSTNFFR